MLLVCAMEQDTEFLEHGSVVKEWIANGHKVVIDHEGQEEAFTLAHSSSKEKLGYTTSEGHMVVLGYTVI